jgi:hypothetical protein
LNSLLGGPVCDELEDRVRPEGVVVVLVLIARQDAVDPRADQFGQSVLGEVRIAGIVEGAGEAPGEPDALLELADREQPGVAGELARGRLDDERRAEEIEDLGPFGWYTREIVSGKEARPVGSPGLTRTPVKDSGIHPGSGPKRPAGDFEPVGAVDE